MSLSIVDRNGVMSEGLRQLAERRLRFALARFESRIRGISVVMEDVNGPRGGIDKSCRITVRLQGASGASDVTVSDQDADAAKCVSRAAERVGRAVGRAIERQRDFVRAKGRDSRRA